MKPFVQLIYANKKLKNLFFSGREKKIVQRNLENQTPVSGSQCVIKVFIKSNIKL
jgi:hypothetical protein